MAKAKPQEVAKDFMGYTETFRTVAAETDYYDVVCLKQIEANGPWSHATASFPTQAEADAYADNLREGRHGAVKVIPRNWA